MSSYKFDFIAGQQTHTDMTSTNNKIREGLETLERYAEQHLAEWTGDARLAYINAKAEWDAAALRMTEALDRGGAALAAIHAEYEHAERAGQKMWSDS